MGQTVFNRNITKKRAGAFVDYQGLDVGDVVTGRNEIATAIFPGRFVVGGTNDQDVKIQDSGVVLGGAEFYVGVAKENTNRERTRGDGVTATAGYIQDSIVPVARTSRIYVECEEAVVKGEQVWVRFVAGAGGTVIGQVGNDVDTASREAVNATFSETITTAGLVGVDLNMPQMPRT